MCYLFFSPLFSSSAREAIAYHLPENNLKILVPVLERFVVSGFFSIMLLRIILLAHGLLS